MSTNLEQAAQAASELAELTARIASHPARRCLLLMDPVLRPLEAELEDGPWQHHGQLAHTSVAVTHPNVDASAYPVLTALRLDHEAERTLLGHSVQEAIAELQPEQLRKGRGRRIGGWIVTNAAAEDVAAHLAQAMVQRHPAGSPVWLRLHDPAVLWAVSGWLQPHQMAALLDPLGTAGSFNLLTPAAQLLSLQADSPDPIHAPADDQGLDLSTGQWAAIDCVEPLNAALRNWGAITPEQLRPARSTAFAAIRRALAMGFADPIDLALYGRYALAVHARFDFHPLVVTRLRARRPGEYFGGMVADLTHQDWARIAREAPPPELTDGSHKANQNK